MPEHTRYLSLPLPPPSQRTEHPIFMAQVGPMRKWAQGENGGLIPCHLASWRVENMQRGVKLGWAGATHSMM
jgi:hypothetical protein